MEAFAMGILLSRIRIQNFRSVESMDVELGVTNLLIGQNNSGKSNFLRAVNIALGAMTDVSDTDIFVAHGERLPKTKGAVIDIMFNPVDGNGNAVRNFSDFWMGVFTESWITTSPEGSFAGIRTEIKYDVSKDNYAISRKCIQQWNDSIESAQVSKKLSFNEDMRQYLSAFYMDANRDIVQDLRNRRSFFGRVTSGYDMTDAKVRKIEEQLSYVNAMIIESIPSLQQTKDKIAAIGQTIGATSSNVEIEPLTRKLSDLNRGMDIVMQDGGASFPISQNGYGTRSWISFLTLSAFVENQAEKIKTDDDEAEQYVMLTMEEPEAHLHPQAQRQLFSQMQDFTGQKIISTHSPSVVAQSALANALYFGKRNGKTTAIRYRNVDTESSSEDELILREVINTRADILFSSAVILCEGITEELALPVYFQEYFGCAPFSLGASVINIGGKDKYKPYLSLIKDFDIPWFIFSDGEDDAVKAVKAAIKAVFDAEYTDYDGIVILENGDEYETYLLREGYEHAIITAINEYEEDDNYLDSYIVRMQGQKRKSSIATKLGLSTDRDYSIAAGRDIALKDLCLERKTDYALPVSRKIVTLEDSDKRIPQMVSNLFYELAKTLGIDVATQVSQTEE